MSLPAGYDEVDVGGVRGFAVEGATSWLRDVLAGGTSLRQWAAARASGTPLRGRGEVFSVPAPVPGPQGRERWVVRPYQRGGAVAAPLLGDRYLAVGRPRPVQELIAACNARSRGIPTPAVVAGAVYPTTIWYRADLVTEQVPDAVDLAEVLFGANAPGIETEPALVAAGKLVRRLERLGIMHPDLNAKNLLLTRKEDDVEAHLVDLDGCCARAPGVPAPAFHMRKRLERSLRKFQRRSGRGLSRAAWSALRSGFEEKGGPPS